MAQQLGPIDVLCDAPAYSVVQACNMIGVRDPEDVRWVRVSHLSEELPMSGLSVGRFWKLFQNVVGPARDPSTCTCGQKLPLLEGYAFTFSNGNELRYVLGQCRRCLTVYWEEHDRR
jgi:hypothetical protein